MPFSMMKDMMHCWLRMSVFYNSADTLTCFYALRTSSYSLLHSLLGTADAMVVACKMHMQETIFGLRLGKAFKPQSCRKFRPQSVS